MIGIIWAEAAGGVIGRGGEIPWRLVEDQAHFRSCTAGATVVMGRRTWDSLPDRYRPLPGRRNVVITARAGFHPEGAQVAADLTSALAAADGDVWVIGGARVYGEALALADRVERTEVDLAVDGDTWAPVLDSGWRPVRRDPARGWHTSRSGLRYRITTYLRGPDVAPPLRDTA